MGYTVQEVAELLKLPEAEVLRCLKEGVLATPWSPESGGEVRLEFQDLVLLRSVAALTAARIPSRRVRRALKSLKERLPRETPLSALQVGSEAGQVVVREGNQVWDAESQQLFLKLDLAHPTRTVAPEAPRELHGGAAEAWYERGCTLDGHDPAGATRAYREALARDPSHAGALINLGRLFHETDDLVQAEAHFRRAVALRPDDPTVAFNLAVVLEDQGQTEAAIATYARALFLDPAFGDAHFNLARLYEERGDRLAALRHLSAYRNLQAS